MFVMHWQKVISERKRKHYKTLIVADYNHHMSNRYSTWKWMKNLALPSVRAGDFE
jgi:hypothetical protein